MNKLPQETISHIMLHISDIHTIKLARLTCKALYNAHPIEKLIGVDKITGAWLLSLETPQRWLKPDMRQPDFTVCVHDRVITMYSHTDNSRTKTESHQPLSRKYVFPSVDNHRCIITMKTGACTLSIMHNLDEDEDEVVVSNHNDSISAFCEMPSLLYMATADGIIYTLDLQQDTQGICNQFLTNHNTPLVQLDFQPLKQQPDEPLVINKFSTLDGKTFVYLVNADTIAVFSPREPPVLIKADAPILDFWIINNQAIVCWVKPNTMRLLYVQAKRFVTTAVIPVPETAAIHITPALCSTWFLDHSKRLFRTGANFPHTKQLVLTLPKSAAFFRKRANKLHHLLKESRAANALLAMRLEYTQSQYETLKSKVGFQ